ncbi:MAG: twin-arginine translocation signal domain-containing protein [Betaproteobacteria bacterium]|nr:MAG: twin-arginine translocation signal domain-containing protein [Betaproteobacteria bacterium]
MSERTPRLSRRNFLLTIGAGGTAAAAAIVAKPSRPAVQAHEKARRGTGGYQESAHVRNYYRTAKV